MPIPNIRADFLCCVWELAVCWFEREAWVENVLSKPENPDLETYLMRRLNADV